MDCRPLPGQRCFFSAIIESVIENVTTEAVVCPRVRRTFANCFPYTLDHTVKHFSNVANRPDAFIITGDIQAMWLRDSARQVMPYLEFMQHDSNLRSLVAGVIRRQVACVLIDPYANAFRLDGEDEGPGEWDSDITDMKSGLHERKWECDSLCSFLDLSMSYIESVNDRKLVDEPDFVRAVETVMDVFEQQQRFHGPGAYCFRRKTDWGPDAVMENGYGQIWKPCGAIFSTFRPSDDSTMFGFNTPQNLYAMNTLGHVIAVFHGYDSHAELRKRALCIRERIYNAIKTHAIGEHMHYGRIFCYEFDGFGNKLFMDDANVPSLLSIPICSRDVLTEDESLLEVYQNTRKFVLSADNPFFFRSESCSGVGSPHTMALPKRIWPLSILVRGLTTVNADEIMECIRMAVETDGGSYLMHESFEAEDPTRFTRASFAWANATFGALVLHARKHAPDELRRLVIK